MPCTGRGREAAHWKLRARSVEVEASRRKRGRAVSCAQEVPDSEACKRQKHCKLHDHCRLFLCWISRSYFSRSSSVCFVHYGFSAMYSSLDAASSLRYLSATGLVFSSICSALIFAGGQELQYVSGLHPGLVHRIP